MGTPEACNSRVRSSVTPSMRCSQAGSLVASWNGTKARLCGVPTGVGGRGGLRILCDCHAPIVATTTNAATPSTAAARRPGRGRNGHARPVHEFVSKDWA